MNDAEKLKEVGNSIFSLICDVESKYDGKSTWQVDGQFVLRRLYDMAEMIGYKIDRSLVE